MADNPTISSIPSPLITGQNTVLQFAAANENGGFDVGTVNGVSTQVVNNPLTLNQYINSTPQQLGENTIASGFLGFIEPNPTIGSMPPPAGLTPEEKTQKAQQDLNTSLNNAFLNSYTVTEEDIAELEIATRLVTKKDGKNKVDNQKEEDNKKGLGLIYKKFSANLNLNRKYLLLSMLVYGFDYKVLTANLNPNQNECTIDDNFIKNFQDLIKDEELAKYIKQTPAYDKGCFDGYGAYGATAITGDSHQSNPMTGAARHQPSLTEKLLNSIHPDAYKNIESFCNKIRTRSWLALPKNGFGSLSKIVHGIQASIEAFQEMIADMYQGCIEVIQQVYAYLNGVMVAVQKKIISIINENIPLDFICLILDTLQVLMDDINFFTSLFQMSGPFLNYLNNFQSFLNSASQFVSNPLSTIQAYLPEEVNNIINLVNQIGADPNGFIADQLNNYGYGYVLNALQGNLVGAISNKYGPQYAAITPLGNILTKATAVYSRFGGQFPATPATLGPNIYTGPQGMSVDVNGNPVRLKSVSSSDISDVSKTTRNLGNNIGSIIGNVGENLKTNASQIGAGLEEAGEGFKGLPSDVSNFFGGIGNTVKKVTGTGG